MGTHPALSLTSFTFTGQRSSITGLMFYNARWLDVTIGRFTSPDTVVPNIARSDNFDRYAYVLNSPTNFVDPSGHRRECVEGGSCVDTVQGSPGSAATMDVNLATSGIPQGKFEAQYTKIGDPLRWHYNLCGEIAVSMIYETVTGYSDTLPAIYETSPATRKLGDGTNTYELAQMCAAVFPEGWAFRAYNYEYVYWFDAGETWSNPINSRVLPAHWYAKGETDVKGQPTRMLRSGHYVIARVALNPETGKFEVGGVGHWVVLTGISGNRVDINDPFWNRQTEMAWDDFYKVFLKNIVEFIPPTRYERPIPY